MGKVLIEKDGDVVRRKLITDRAEIAATKEFADRIQEKCNSPRIRKKHGEVVLIGAFTHDQHNEIMNIAEAHYGDLLGNIQKGEQANVMADVIESKTVKEFMDV